jgi:uncharacterized cupredoxin-like copper-binding protein
MTKLPTTLLSAAALAVGLAACGSSSSSSSPASTSAAAPTTSTSAAAPTTTASGEAASASDTLTIAAQPSGQLMFNEMAMTAKAGKVTIVFTNKAPEGHNFNVQEGTSGKMLGSTPTFMGGTRTLVVDLKAGKYTFFCGVPGHRAAGMVGTLTVT